MTDNNSKEQWLEALLKVTGQKDIPHSGLYEDIQYPSITSEVLDNPENLKHYISFVEYGIRNTRKLAKLIPTDSQIIDILDISNSGAYSWLEIAVAIRKAQVSDSQTLCYIIGIGDGFYIQAAKFAALASLTKKIIPDTEFLIAAKPASYNKFELDEENNLIRGSSEYTAAAISGVDILLPTPFLLKNEDESIRLSSNIIDILKYESKLDKSCIQWKGAYALSNLAYTIGKKAWNYLLEKADDTDDDFLLGATRLANQHNKARQSNQNNSSTTRIGINSYKIIDTNADIFILGMYDNSDLESIINELRYEGYDITVHTSESYESLITNYELSSTQVTILYSESANSIELANLCREMKNSDAINMKDRAIQILDKKLTKRNIIQLLSRDSQ